MSDEQKKKVFFYADEDARHYDCVEELTQPCIGLMHDTMVDLVEYSLQWKQETGKGQPLHVLVVASGTGAEVLRLLVRFPNIRIVAIDFSPPMNREFRRKFASMFPAIAFESRVTLIEEDFFGSACCPKNLMALLPTVVQPHGFDAVVGGFFLNHYALDTQKDFYIRAYALLRTGGILVLAEGIHFQSEKLSEFAHDFGERWIRKQLSEPDPHLRRNYEELGATAIPLHGKWLEHWRTAHTYAPDYLLAPTQPPMSHANSVSHTDMALAAGFQEVGFPFRLWEAAILWAAKPERGTQIHDKATSDTRGVVR